MLSENLDNAASLERAAHVALCLVADLQSATDTISSLTTAGKHSTTTNGNSNSNNQELPSLRTPLEQDTEQAEFLLKLAPRIRRLESDTTQALCQRLEIVLQQWQELQEKQQEHDSTSTQQNQKQQQTLLIILGHCMRGLAILGRGKDVESIFARVAIMPVLRRHISMGRLDQGGARGECHGLKSLLQEITQTIAAQFQPILQMAQDMFSTISVADASNNSTNTMHVVDLVTAGVWVPIATALVADAGIQMAIFSPGIASILQSNYLALDAFLAHLAERLLLSTDSDRNNEKAVAAAAAAQDRMYAHPKTAEFSKKWNLPIYYQLRFGECCKRLNAAVEQTRREGWVAQVTTFTDRDKEKSHIAELGFEISLFLELYDILVSLWNADVFLMPLTNRFLRGSVQLVGRTVEFVANGMDGTIMFGEEKAAANGEENGTQSSAIAMPVRNSYCWGETEHDVAAVAWEMAILESTLRHDYVTTVCNALQRGQQEVNSQVAEELQVAVRDVLKEAADQIQPVVDKAWNEQIVNILTKKCSAPLAAVKGVAATYRMTNRPPPTQASPFVTTILRPLKEFSTEFANRTPERVGLRWKQSIVVTIADRYAAAVEELIATVQRTEGALQRNARGRRTRLAAAGGMSDGEKVTLQLHLDYLTFLANVEEAGINPQTVLGLSKLQELTKEGQKIQEGQNGTSA